MDDGGAVCFPDRTMQSDEKYLLGNQNTSLTGSGCQIAQSTTKQTPTDSVYSLQDVTVSFPAPFDPWGSFHDPLGSLLAPVRELPMPPLVPEPLLQEAQSPTRLLMLADTVTSTGVQCPYSSMMGTMVSYPIISYADNFPLSASFPSAMAPIAEREQSLNSLTGVWQMPSLIDTLPTDAIVVAFCRPYGTDTRSFGGYCRARAVAALTDRCVANALPD